MVDLLEVKPTAGPRQGTESDITLVPRQSPTTLQRISGPATQTGQQAASGTDDFAVGNSADTPTPSFGLRLSNSLLEDNVSLHPLDTNPPLQARSPIADHHAHSPSNAGLRLQTTPVPPQESTAHSPGVDSFTAPVTIPRSTLDQISTTSSAPIRTLSVKAALYASSNTAGSLSPASASSSPGLGPMVAITPLPSPIVLSGSPGSWKRIVERSGSRGSASSADTPAAMQNREVNFTRRSPKKRRAYQGVLTAGSDPYGTQSQNPLEGASNHGRNRSHSEYVPEALHIPRPRNVIVSGSGGPPSGGSFSPPTQHLHREEYLAVQRGIAPPIARPPTPPRSQRSGAESDDGDSPVLRPPKLQTSLPLYFEARTVKRNETRRWRAVRQLGKGTFSEVMLATSQGVEDNMESHKLVDTANPDLDEQQLDPKTLVAVKIVEHGPSGGASAERMETSLKRELEILRLIHHPSLVHLKAFSTDEKHTLLILNYCPGGDLFELASLKHDLLVAALIQRIFAELVAAVRYLHRQHIVHRDIKLENVLLNLPRSDLPTITDWRRYPRPVITLTDLGLSRFIAQPPESPLLTTPCGSQDYAAPEILMGQPYDGRATDAWALGVLLYALMEGRLPFDPLPGAKGDLTMLIARTPHRVARCEWSWVKWADADGEWDPVKGRALEGGKGCVEGLLKRARSRLSLDVVAEFDWVMSGIDLEGGFVRLAEDEA